MGAVSSFVAAPKAQDGTASQGSSLDQEAYRERNVVERTINRPKSFGRVATRYEKRAVNYHRTMVTIAAIVLWV